MNVLPIEYLLELTEGSTWLVKHKRAGATTEVKLTTFNEKGFDNSLGIPVAFEDVIFVECVELLPRAEGATYPRLWVFPGQYARPF